MISMNQHRFESSGHEECPVTVATAGPAVATAGPAAAATGLAAATASPICILDSYISRRKWLYVIIY